MYCEQSFVSSQSERLKIIGEAFSSVPEASICTGRHPGDGACTQKPRNGRRSTETSGFPGTSYSIYSERRCHSLQACYAGASDHG